jgi:putative addiction module component (TIGR02574 family)
MNSRSETVLQDALAMPIADRAWLAHCLIASIDQPPEDDVEKAWISLAEDRAAEIDRGEKKPVSWEEIKAKVRNGRDGT